MLDVSAPNDTKLNINGLSNTGWYIRYPSPSDWHINANSYFQVQTNSLVNISLINDIYVACVVDYKNSTALTTKIVLVDTTGNKVFETYRLSNLF